MQRLLRVPLFVSDVCRHTHCTLSHHNHRTIIFSKSYYSSSWCWCCRFCCRLSFIVYPAYGFNSSNGLKWHGKRVSLLNTAWIHRLAVKCFFTPRLFERAYTHKIIKRHTRALTRVRQGPKKLDGIQAFTAVITGRKSIFPCVAYSSIRQTCSRISDRLGTFIVTAMVGYTKQKYVGERFLFNFCLIKLCRVRSRTAP